MGHPEVRGSRSGDDQSRTPPGTFGPTSWNELISAFEKTDLGAGGTDE